MIVILRWLAFLSIFWTISLLLIQLIQSTRRRTKDYSLRTGDPYAGIIYNFTAAMLPSHKETIRKHPVKFGIGLILHAGAFLAIFTLLFTLVTDRAFHSFPLLISLIQFASVSSGIYLFVRRITAKEISGISHPDDYFASAITTVFILISMLFSLSIVDQSAFYGTAILLFFYFPVGKLKHALFFFIVRADYGARLGYRGIYPVHVQK